MILLDYLFGQLRCYRKWSGGTWVKWDGDILWKKVYNKWGHITFIEGDQLEEWD